MLVTLSIYGRIQSPSLSEVVQPVSVVSSDSVADDNVGGAEAVIELAFVGLHVALTQRSMTMLPEISLPLTR